MQYVYCEKRYTSKWDLFDLIIWHADGQGLSLFKCEHV